MNEDIRIDELIELLFKFESNKPRFVSMTPTQDHPFRESYWINSPFLNEEESNIAYLDAKLPSKDIPGDMRFAMLTSSGGGTINSFCAVKKNDKRLFSRLDYKKAYFCDKVFEYCPITFGEKGEVHRPIGGSFYFGLQKEIWVPLNTKAWDYSPELKERTPKFFSLASSLYHMLDYKWHASIRATNYGIKIPIHPATARFFFKNRDKSFGKSRKSAIRNFVIEHNRYVQSKPDAVLVKKHLRGAVNFDWMGFNVLIDPSAFDIRELQKNVRQ